MAETMVQQLRRKAAERKAKVADEVAAEAPRETVAPEVLMDAIQSPAHPPKKRGRPKKVPPVNAVDNDGIGKGGLVVCVNCLPVGHLDVIKFGSIIDAAGAYLYPDAGHWQLSDDGHYVDRQGAMRAEIYERCKALEGVLVVDARDSDQGKFSGLLDAVARVTYKALS